jgi:hypothetical protein
MQLATQYTTSIADEPDRYQITILEYLTVAVLKVSIDTIIRKSEKRKKMYLTSGSGEGRFKLRCPVLRIPLETLEEFNLENQVQ